MDIEHFHTNVDATENTTSNIKRVFLHVKYFENEVRRLNIGFNPEKDLLEFRTAVAVAAAASIGTDAATLGTFTGYGEAFVSAIAQHMMKAGLWGRDKSPIDRWIEAESEVIAFTLDVLVAEGILEAEIINGEFVYRKPSPN